MRLTAWAGRNFSYNPYQFYPESKTYQILDAKELFSAMFQYDNDSFPNDWDLKRIIVVGSQASGKTIFIKSLIKFIYSLYPEHHDKINAFRIYDLNVLKEKKRAEILKKPIQIIVIDDAVKKGLDSRKSLSSDNVSFTQNYFQIRHILEQYRPNGICILIIATQDFKAVDKRVRENVQLVVFKTFYNKYWFRKMFLDEDTIEFVRDATNEGLIKTNRKARECGIFLTQTGDMGIFKNHNVGKNEIKIPFFEYENLKHKYTKILEEKLLNRFPNILDMPDKVVKGFLKMEIVDILKEIDESISWTNSELLSIIQKICYIEEMNSEKKETSLNSTQLTFENIQTKNHQNILKTDITDFPQNKPISNRKKIFNYLSFDPSASNSKLYNIFSDMKKSSIRQYRNQFRKNYKKIVI